MSERFIAYGDVFFALVSVALLVEATTRRDWVLGSVAGSNALYFAMHAARELSEAAMSERGDIWPRPESGEVLSMRARIVHLEAELSAERRATRTAVESLVAHRERIEKLEAVREAARKYRSYGSKGARYWLEHWSGCAAQNGGPCQCGADAVEAVLAALDTTSEAPVTNPAAEAPGEQLRRIPGAAEAGTTVPGAAGWKRSSGASDSPPSNEPVATGPATEAPSSLAGAAAVKSAPHATERGGTSAVISGPAFTPPERSADAEPGRPGREGAGSSPAAGATSPTPRWRVGRKVGRTVYLNDRLVGVFDTAELASYAVTQMNAGPLEPTHHNQGEGDGTMQGMRTGGVEAARDGMQQAGEADEPTQGRSGEPRKAEAVAPEDRCECGHVRSEHTEAIYTYVCWDDSDGICKCQGFRPASAAQPCVICGATGIEHSYHEPAAPAAQGARWKCCECGMDEPIHARNCGRSRAPAAAPEEGAQKYSNAVSASNHAESRSNPGSSDQICENYSEKYSSAAPEEGKAPADCWHTPHCLTVERHESRASVPLSDLEALAERWEERRKKFQSEALALRGGADPSYLNGRSFTFGECLFDLRFLIEKARGGK